MVWTFVVASVSGLVLALPGDWLRRRRLGSTEAVATVNLVAVAVAWAAMTLAGLVHGTAGAVALVLGLVVGNAGADLLAGQWWGAVGDR